MNSIQLIENRTLKLTNVLSYPMENDSFGDLERIIPQMENYVKAKGYQPIGPLIQHTDPIVSEDGTVSIITHMMRQTSGYIHQVESPYTIRSIIRVKNCIYARYRGNEINVKLAIDKIRVYAFEHDINIKNDSWIIYVNQIDDDVIADVFVERATDEPNAESVE